MADSISAVDRPPSDDLLIVEYLSVMAEVFDKPLSAKLAAVYCAAWNGINIQTLKEAAKKWVASQRRFPLPIDIIELVADESLTEDAA